MKLSQRRWIDAGLAYIRAIFILGQQGGPCVLGKCSRMTEAYRNLSYEGPGQDCGKAYVMSDGDRRSGLDCK